MWSRLQKGLSPFSFTIRDVFVKGQTYAMENAIHTGCPHGEEGWYTVLGYLNPKWHVDWGGETVFYNTARTDIVYAVVPRPGRIAFFDASFDHWGRAPTRNTRDLRVTMVFCLAGAKDSPAP